jgi:hypothetical protein
MALFQTWLPINWWKTNRRYHPIEPKWLLYLNNAYIEALSDILEFRMVKYFHRFLSLSEAVLAILYKL